MNYKKCYNKYIYIHFAPWELSAIEKTTIIRFGIQLNLIIRVRTNGNIYTASRITLYSLVMAFVRKTWHFFFLTAVVQICCIKNTVFQHYVNNYSLVAFNEEMNRIFLMDSHLNKNLTRNCLCLHVENQMSNLLDFPNKIHKYL